MAVKQDEIHAEVERIVRKPGVVPNRAAVVPVFDHIPTDADFGGSPSNGVLAIHGDDLYARIGGTFKKATLA